MRYFEILYHEHIPSVFLASLRFHLLPSAFLASHLLGLERCVVELRGAVLRSPRTMLRALRKTDGQVGEMDPNLMDFERSKRCENLRVNSGMKII